MASSVDGTAFEPASSPPPSRDHEDLDPAAFLKTVRELSEKREREDAERYRKLEEEVERSRAERAARRSERERSLSPEKTELPSLPSSLTLRSRPNAAIGSPPPSTPPPASTFAMADNATNPPSPTKDIPEFKGFGSIRRPAASSTSNTAQVSETSFQPSPSASSLARSGTLSWQRRPTSRGGSRPQSVVGPEIGGSSSREGSRPQSVASPETSAHATSASADEREPSRHQIAASLGSRDPSWFRQTADRGTGSAAYRKSKEEAVPDESVASGRRGLPGISRESSIEPEPQSSPAPSESVKSETSTRFGSVRGSGVSSNRFSAGTSTSTSRKPDLKALVAADEAQHDASPLSEKASASAGDANDLGRTLSMSSSQARLAGATERPSSPTKGMGGFVQSAMMKRSDSVSKRWSAQPGGSLSRQNSTASVRTGLGGLQGSHSMPRLEPTPGSREGSNEPSSRPTSSSSNLTHLAYTQGRDDNDVFVRPALPHHSRSKTVTSVYSTTGEDGATSPPSSPTKRFSPTKSSWIESALTRPDSPKPIVAKNAQPSWMEGLAKAKAQRASAESTPHSEKPKLAEDEPARSSSPTKTTPFGQSMLKRSESRDLSLTQAVSPPTVHMKPSTALSKATSFDGEKSIIATAGVAETRERQQEPVPDPDTQSAQQPDQSQPSIEEAPSELSKPKPSPSVGFKNKPETPPKPPTDFRGTLRSRPPVDRSQNETPEFMNKFGNLRKARTENYVAPDVLKNNITRGKAELAKTGGPVKTVRRDELKESLLAKKEDWKKAKEEGRELPGQLHERKTSGPPSTPGKPEALLKRDLLGRPERGVLLPSPEKAKETTPEALARHKSLKDKPKIEAPTEKARAPVTVTQPRFEPLSKQTSAPAFLEHKQENSRLASRFNPGLASMLARGPPPMSTGSSAPSRSESPAVPERTTIQTPDIPSEPSADGAPLQDMRKGRARGPKKRKAVAGESETSVSEHLSKEPAPEREQEVDRTESPALPVQFAKPRALPGSAASIMAASLKAESKNGTILEPSKATAASRLGDEHPATPAKSPAPFAQPYSTSASTPASTPRGETSTSRGFNSMNKALGTPAEDNKENTNGNLPSVKSAATLWGREAAAKQTAAPPQIQLPSKRDEEAAMRSAGLLASTSSQPSSSNGLGISVEKTSEHVSTPPASAGLPPKPGKPSRVVSGQLQEASPNKGDRRTPRKNQTEAERLLTASFGTMTIPQRPLSIDARVLISSSNEDVVKVMTTLRKSIQEVFSDGSLRSLPPREEYTLFDEAVYICTCVSAGTGSIAKRHHVFLWTGDAASKSSIENAQLAAKKIARELGSTTTVTCQQGYETADFLQALGGIMVSRRGSRQGAPKQYILCGRKHLGNITFDEVDHSVKSLCSGFVYLISHPVTLQQTKLYLWKGSASSTEEISAARLAAMDLSETGEIIEVDDGAEFASFLKVFGPSTTKSDIPKSSPLWQAKSRGPVDFVVKLFRVQLSETKASLITSIFTRRPSWNSVSPSRSPNRSNDTVKVEVKHLSPFTQSDLDADGIYLLDAHTEIYVLVGPLLASQPENVRGILLGQSLLFASDYVNVCAEERGQRPRGHVLLRGVPADFSLLFRYWSHEEGLWGTASLMAGSRSKEVAMLELEEAKEVLGIA